MRLLLLFVLALAACAAGGANPPVPTVARQPAGPASKLLIEEVQGRGSSIAYRYDGIDYPSPEEALAALRRTEDVDFATLHPVAAPVGGSLRIVISQRPAQWVGKDSAGRLVAGPAPLSAGIAVTVEHQVAALQQSHLFSEVTVEHGAAPFPDERNVPLPGAAPADFVLWHDSRAWHMRIDDGNPVDLAPRLANLAVWINNVRFAASQAKTAGVNGVSYTPDDNWRSVIVRYRGVRYESADALASALAASHDAEVAALTPLHDRLGGKALIVLSTQSQSKPLFTVTSAPAEVNEMIAGTTRVSYLAGSKRRADGLRQSHLFDTLTIRSEDVADVPLRGYDYVLFETADRPLLWKFKVKEGEAQTLTLPKGEISLAQTVEAIREALRAARQKGSNG